MSSNFDFKKIAVIPVYRDIVNAVRVLGKFRNGYVDGICLVVDCPEEDDLKEIKRATTKIETPVFIIANKERKGIGYAIREGIEYGLANHYGVAVVMAGNNKDDPGEIPRLLTPIVKEGFDYVQGSRFLPGEKESRILSCAESSVDFIHLFGLCALTSGAPTLLMDSGLTN